MEFDPNDLDGFELFLTLGRLVSPRPVGWISTTDGDGTDNVAPYSFLTPVSVDPPVVAFQAAPHPDGTLKDTARNAMDTGEFVYNLVVEGVFEPMNDSAAHLAESEFDAVGIEREAAATVAPPRVAASPAALECRVREVVSIEETRVVFGDVEHVAVDDAYLADGLVDVDRLESNLVGHLADADYTRLDCFRQEQPE